MNISSAVYGPVCVMNDTEKCKHESGQHIFITKGIRITLIKKEAAVIHHIYVFSFICLTASRTMLLAPFFITSALPFLITTMRSCTPQRATGTSE